MTPYGGPPQWQWRRYGPPRRWRRHGPPPFVRRIGCAFAAMIALAAAVSGALVAVFARLRPAAWALAVAIAVAIVISIVTGFVLTIRRATRFFHEQERLRRDLMADVAHELRTPLSILQGRIEGMIDGVYPRDGDHLAALLTETRHLSRLVEDVRTVANAEAGALDLQKESTDIGELVRESAAAVAVAVDLDVPSDLPHIQADPVRIREVLLNLLTNAEAAAHARLSVAAHATAKEIVISVHDDGDGIAPDELPYVFDRFHKGRTSRGSGLGLSIARRLVVAHGGSIHIDSATGAGTTVTMSLPR